MSLLGQTARYLLLSALAITLLGSIGFYTLIHRKIQHEVDEILSSQVEHVRLRLKQRALPDTPLTGWTDNPRIERVSSPGTTRFSNEIQFDSLDDNRRVTLRQLVQTVRVNGQFYRVRMQVPYYEFDELARDVSTGVILAFLGLMSLSVLIGLGLARRLWRPFHATVDQLQHVQLDTGIEPAFPASPVYEFTLLSQSLTALTQKLRRQFRLQKQFTENASHELQTPLAVATAELDQLRQSDRLTESDHDHLTQASAALSRLSQVNRSLLLLTQVENDQFIDAEPVDLSTLIGKYVAEYEPFFTHKRIAISQAVTPAIVLTINRQLVSIVLTNLFKNAVRHSESGGYVYLTLTPDALAITNSGLPLPFADSLLFTRFVRNPARPDSTGLGLALVKQIADRYHLPLTHHYDTAKRTHTFRLGLRPTATV
jgi:signal transduction histidine kinase